MADERRIVIELKATGGDTNGEEADEDDGTATKERKQAIKSALSKTIGYVYKEISAQFDYQVGVYTSLTEDYKTQISISNIQATVGKVKSLASSTISTAMLGAMAGGVYGAIAGAVVGFAAETVSIGLETSRQWSQQRIGLATGDKNAQYAQSRLGLIDNGRGTQN